jgi:patatin-like phospholipase/acyl hydrolase
MSIHYLQFIYLLHEEKEMEDKVRILSISGGGLRGLITAIILKRLNEHPDIKGFLDQTYLFAGTSTGAIVASGLILGKTPQELVDLYLKQGPKIFSHTTGHDIRTLNGYTGPKYENKNIKAVLSDMFGSIKFKDLTKKLLIPTLNLDNKDSDINLRRWKPKFFNNFLGDHGDPEVLLKDALLYTTSAPTFFPAEGYIDGAVVANNPSHAALMQIISNKNDLSERFKLENVILLDIGTGINNTYIEENPLKYGTIQWISPLINLLMDASTDIVRYTCSQLLGDGYIQLEPVLSVDNVIAMDDTSKFQDMQNIANTFDIEPYVKFIKDKWI